MDTSTAGGAMAEGGLAHPTSIPVRASHLSEAVAAVADLKDPDLRKIAFEAEIGRIAERRKRIDRILGYSGALLTLIAGGVGLFITFAGYLDAQQDAHQKEAVTRLKEAEARTKEAEARTAEAMKPFMDTKRQRYNEVLQVVGAIAAQDQVPEKLQASKRRFWELYWAELSLVEDADVERAMVHLGNLIEPDKEMTEFQKATLDFAHLIRAKVTHLESSAE